MWMLLKLLSIIDNNNFHPVQTCLHCGLGFVFILCLPIIVGTTTSLILL